MGLLSGLLHGPEMHADYLPWDDHWYSTVAGVGTIVGIPVTPLVSLQVAAVFACVKVISETLASLPLIVYERSADGGKQRATDLPLYELLHESPNAWQTAVEFIDDEQGHACLHGNAYAEIIPGARGAVDELVPIRPEAVKVEQLTSRRLRYQVQQADGTWRPLTQDQVFHVRGRSLDFVTGLSTQTQARDAIALARAIEMYGSKFFANDASVGLVVEHPTTLSPKAYERLKEAFTRTYTGVSNAHKPKVLEEGAKLTRVAMTAAKEAQLTEAESAAVVSICRYFRVPPHKVQHLLHATFSNIEHQGIEFVTDTMLPWVRRWEARINASLITDRRYFAAFLLTGLLRGDNAARASYYQSRFNIGSLSINDIRRLEDENPLPGDIGDRYFVQGALVPVDKVDQFAGGKPRSQAMRPAQDDGEDDATNDEAAPPPARRALAAAPARVAPVRAFRLLFADAAERIARHEIREIEKRLPKAPEDPERFTRWVTEFYAGPASVYAARTLQPLAEAWGEETGVSLSPETLTTAVSAGGYGWPEAWDAWCAARPAGILATLGEAFALDSASVAALTPDDGPPDLAALIDARVRAALPAAAPAAATTVLVEAQGTVKQNLVKHYDVVRDAEGQIVGLSVREVFDLQGAA